MAQALHVEVGLVAKHDGELLEQHVQDVVVAHKDLLLLAKLGECVLGCHGSWRGRDQGTVRTLNVLEHLFRDDVGADVRVLGEKDDDFVTGDSDSHICAACICDGQ